MRAIGTSSLAGLLEALKTFGSHLVKGLIYTLFAMSMVWIGFTLMTASNPPACKVSKR